MPQTWEELAAGAKKIQDAERGADKDFQGFVFQAKAYEGLTCDALEWVYSYGGGSIIESNGKISINNGNAAKALDTAASWIGKIAPQGVLNYGEEDARGDHARQRDRRDHSPERLDSRAAIDERRASPSSEARSCARSTDEPARTGHMTRYAA